MKKYSFILLSLFFVACASTTDIFPQVPVTTDINLLELPNPLAIVADTANSQVIVLNSNFDLFYGQGSIYTLEVDATNPAAPVLTATSGLSVANFSGEAAFDGVNLYVPFREAISEDSDTDQIFRYVVADGLVTEADSGTTGPNPYGIDLSGGELFVASDEALEIFDLNLSLTAEIDLTVAATAGVATTASKHVESVVVDTATDRAYVSNRTGKLFVVDLTTNTLTHVIDGPDNTRGIATDGTYIYAVDGNPAALWVLDPSRLPAATAAVQEVDDSVLVVKVIDLGVNPNGIVLDTVNNRAFVSNTGENTVSVIDLALLRETARISLAYEDTGFKTGRQPFGMAVGTFAGAPLVFVTNSDANTVSVINATLLQVVASFPE